MEQTNIKMKKMLIVFICLLWSIDSLASDHYFAQSGTDAGTCNAAACTNSGAPCKTITCANAVIAALSNGANQILFNRGDTWTFGTPEADELSILASGTSASVRTVIGDYGSGNLPKFNGNSLVAAYGIIRVYTESYITIQNLEIYGMDKNAIGCNPTTPTAITDLKITGCTIYGDANHDGGFPLIDLQSGNVPGGLTGIEISYCTIYGSTETSTVWDGIKITDGITSSSIHHCTIYNILHNPIDTLEHLNAQIDIYSNNLYSFGAAGIYGVALADCSIYDNDIHDAIWACNPSYGIRIDNYDGVAANPHNIVIRNNRIWNIWQDNNEEQYTYPHTNTKAMWLQNFGVGYLNIYNNTIYHNTTTIFQTGNGSATIDNHNNLAYANHDATADLANYGSDPLFVSVVTPKFNLLSGSPVIDQGVEVGLAFTGAAPDLGAYEGIGGIITLNGSGTMTLGSGGSAVLR